MRPTLSLELTSRGACDTLCHMKTITIRELHAKTGEWVRLAAHFGELGVTDRGRTVAKIVPDEDSREIPYFARRLSSPAFQKMLKSGKLLGGTDSTESISTDRGGR